MSPATAAALALGRRLVAELGPRLPAGAVVEWADAYGVPASPTLTAYRLESKGALR